MCSDNNVVKTDTDQEVLLDDHLKSLRSLNLGPIEAIPEYLEQYGDNEDTARALQGMLFEDKDIGWCEVTGNTVDHGTNVIYYTPVRQIGLFDAEDHASLAEILTVVRNIPTVSKILDYQPSRKLVLTAKQHYKCVMRALSTKRKSINYGTMV